MKKLLKLLLVALLAFSFVGCNKDNNNNNNETNNLSQQWLDSDGYVHVNVVCPQTLPTLEPLSTTSGVYTACLWDMMYDYLLKDNLDGTYGPRLAERWEVSDDGKEFIFYLLEGVEFSNGTPFNAYDVAATMQRYIDKKGTEYNVAGIWLLLDSYEVIDDYTIKIRFTQPYGTALYEFANAVIFSAEDYAELGDEYFTNGHCIGTGKWVLEDFKESQYITLKINENYREPITTNVQKFTLNFMSENASMVTGLLSGDFDDATRISSDLLSMLSGQDKLNIQHVASTSILMIGLQCGEGSVFNDLAVRQAFYYAIDRQGICDNILVGSHPTAQYLPEGTNGYVSANVMAYDLNKAKELLANSSYNGEKIVLEVNSGLPSVDDVFVYICDTLTEAGFNVTYNKVETAYLGEIRKTGDFTAYAITDNIQIDNGRALQVRFGNPGQNHNLDNQELYDLIAELQTTVDANKRTDILTEINTLIYENCGPCCPVVAYAFNNVTRVGLKGVVYTPLGGYLYNNIYIEE
jgi:ABC-type transport system substrate-binding protein